jgi:hypothetical protein
LDVSKVARRGAKRPIDRLHRRCARGKRLADYVPQGHWKTITFVAALGRHGMTGVADN